MTELTSNMRISCKKTLLATILLLISCPTFAGYAITASEIVMLPSSCRQLSEGNFAADAKRYRINAPPPAWMQHFQHYCHGLKSNIRAARATNQRDRIFELKAAVTEFQYVLIHTQPIPKYFPYLAMVRVDLGRTYVKLDNLSEAITQFMKASILKADYNTAYLDLIDTYLKLGNRDEALKVAREGLAHIPNSKALQRHYRELGGKLPYPTPVKSSVTNDTELNNSPSTPAASSSKGKSPEIPDNSVSTKDNPTTQDQDSHYQEPKIGSPTNPWCRFCPPSDVVAPTQPPPTH
jgi:tetratricopeptide (TPR) repeat protein